jgi:chromosome segregation ATPase
MERNYDEVISDMLIQLARMETRMVKADKRMDLTIRRMVKAEERLEAAEHRMREFDDRVRAHDSRMENFDRRLEISLNGVIEFTRMQSQVNEYFLKMIGGGYARVY